MTLLPRPALAFFLAIPALGAAEELHAPELNQTLSLFHDLREELRAQAPRSCPGGPVSVAATLRTVNDNKFFAMDYALLGQRHAGDDLGYTHGYALEIELGLEDRTRLTLVMSNDLFTEPIEGRSYRDEAEMLWVPQHFTEEQKLVLRMDSQKKRRTFYYRAGVGLHVLDSRPSESPLSTSRQQTLLHRGVNTFTPVRFRERLQEHNGEGLRAGILGQGGLGMQHQVFNLADGALELVVFSEAGVELSSLPRASQFTATTGGRLDARGPRLPVVGRPGASVLLDATQRVHADGIVFEPHAEVGVGTPQGELGIEWRGYYGDLPNHVRYNSSGRNREGGNDDVMGFFLRVRLEPAGHP